MGELVPIVAIVGIGIALAGGSALVGRLMAGKKNDKSSS